MKNSKIYNQYASGNSPLKNLTIAEIDGKHERDLLIEKRVKDEI